MFTGLVQDLGKVISLMPYGTGRRLRVETSMDTGDFELGESIAVNGVCLTVAEFTDRTFDADVSGETLNKSNLSGLRTGNAVNLERALRPMDRLGGHFVQGHVDGAGTLSARRSEGEFERFIFTAPQEVEKYLVTKGSVAVDGVSLTVASLEEGGAFSVALIPHTLAGTTLAGLRVGDQVNLEGDILGKYAEKFLTGSDAGGVDMSLLGRAGFLG